MNILTKLNAEVELAFQKHTTKSVYRVFYIGAAIMSVLGIIFMISGNFITGLSCLVFGVTFAIALPYGIKKSNKKLYDSYKGVKENKLVEFEFNEDHYTLKAYVNNEQIDFSKCSYDKLFKVDETNDYFFLYLASNMANCIDKKDLDEKDVDELKNIFINNNVKYKRVK